MSCYTFLSYLINIYFKTKEKVVTNCLNYKSSRNLTIKLYKLKGKILMGIIRFSYKISPFHLYHYSDEKKK